MTSNVASQRIRQGVGLLRTKPARRALLVLAIASALIVLWLRGASYFTSGWGSVGSNDYVEYWSAARLLLEGVDPYDPEAMLAMEESAGMPGPDPILMWNPPWTLAVVLPLALLPFGLASAAWLLLQLALILGCGAVLWRYFAPDDDRHWIGLLLAATFVPGLLALRMGQISPWLLLGVTGFLWAQRDRRDLLAGISLALLLIKPHVTYLFLLAALWWAWRNRRWKVLIGWLAALIGASLIVSLVSPGVFPHYLRAATGPPLYWAPPTIGTWLRLLLGPERGWLQFLPPLVGGLALAAWLWRRRGSWCWEDVTGPLLLASSVTAAYGWSYDQLVLLPAVVALVSRLRFVSQSRRLTILALLAITQCLLVAMNRFRFGDEFFIWYPLVLAGLYWWGAIRGQEHRKTIPLEVALEAHTDR
ncbi:glycosyltransferase family 87 protein [Chloroflexota bacterium]